MVFSEFCLSFAALSLILFYVLIKLDETGDNSGQNITSVLKIFNLKIKQKYLNLIVHCQWRKYMLKYGNR